MSRGGTHIPLFQMHPMFVGVDLVRFYPASVRFDAFVFTDPSEILDGQSGQQRLLTVFPSQWYPGLIMDPIVFKNVHNQVVAVDDFYTARVGQTINIVAAQGVLANDYWPAYMAQPPLGLEVTLVQDATHGTLAFDTDTGAFQFQVPFDTSVGDTATFVYRLAVPELVNIEDEGTVTVEFLDPLPPTPLPATKEDMLAWGYESRVVVQRNKEHKHINIAKYEHARYWSRCQSVRKNLVPGYWFDFVMQNIYNAKVLVVEVTGPTEFRFIDTELRTFSVVVRDYFTVMNSRIFTIQARSIASVSVQAHLTTFE